MLTAFSQNSGGASAHDVVARWLFPPAGEPRCQAALDRIVYDTIRPVSLGAGLLFAILALSHAVILPKGVALPMAITAGLSACTLGGLWYFLGRRELPLSFANLIGAGVFGVAWFNAVLHLLLTFDPRQSTNFALLIIGAGCFFLGPRWFALCAGTTVASWAIAVWFAPASRDWVHFGFMLLAATVLGLLVFTVRLRTCRRLEEMRAQAEGRQQDLEAAMRAARRSEDRYRDLVENSGVLIGTHDITGRVLTVNRAVLEFLEQPDPERLIGRRVSDFLPREVRNDFEVYLNTVLTQGWARGLMRVKTRGDKEKIIEYNNSLRADGLDKPTVRCIGRDVTERVRRQREIRQLNQDLRRRAEELEAANKELASFAYSVSHDLRAPVRHIGAFARLLEESYAGAPPPGAADCLTQIQDGARRMGSLVDDLLNFSGLGRRELIRSRTDLNGLVKVVRDELAVDWKDRAVEWELHDLPVLNCDSSLVRQVMANLLSNALKYSRTRKPALIEVGCAQAGSDSAIFVRDNGVGFDRKYASKLFGVFQRLHRADEFEGNGVGLAIVQRIVQKHGGRVWAESDTDQGATFFFTLGPAAETPVLTTPGG